MHLINKLRAPNKRRVCEYEFYGIQIPNSLHQGGNRLGDETGRHSLKEGVMRGKTGTSANPALPVHLIAAKQQTRNEVFFLCFEVSVSNFSHLF